MLGALQTVEAPYTLVRAHRLLPSERPTAASLCEPFVLRDIKEPKNTMRVMRLPIVAFMVALLVGASPTLALAQAQHAVDPSAIARMVGEHARATEADRTVVRDLLKRPDVATVATAAGVDVARLSAAVETLSPADVARAADAARAVDAQLVASNLTSRGLVGGASTVTISTTTIIIGLLILILIIVAVD